MRLSRLAVLVVTAMFLASVVVYAVAPIVVGASVSVTRSDFLAFPPEGISMRWYSTLVTDARWRAAFVNSLVIAALCTVMATVFGTLTAYGIASMTLRRLRQALVILFILPLAVPHMTLALALYPVFARLGLIGTHIGVALAQALYALPLVVLAVLAVIRRRDLRLAQAARTLGQAPSPLSPW